jgi:polyisoprenoid-binding protein YceI
VIEADSLDTGNDRRDRHLRSPAFFDVERHPQITFTATALSPREEGLTIVGELTIASSHLKVELPMNLEQSTDGERRLAGHTTISRRAAGLAWNVLGMIRGDASVHARLALERASSTS